MKIKKILSILLCLSLLTQNAPVMAFAAQEDDTPDTGHAPDCGYVAGAPDAECTCGAAAANVIQDCTTHNFQPVGSVVKCAVCGVPAAAMIENDDGEVVYFATLGEALVQPSNLTVVEALADCQEDFTIPAGIHFLGGDFCFTGKVINNQYISSGTFTGEVYNRQNSISGGTFTKTVTNDEIISQGIFQGPVINNGNIQNGTFENTVTNNDEIWGGTFNGQIINNGTIYNNGNITLGENFSITNEEDGTVECADNAHIYNVNGTCRLCGISNHKPVEGYILNPENDTHSYQCVCGETHTDPCSGGTQTCKGFQCQFCSDWYGEGNPDAHIPQEGTTYISNDDGTHSYTCGLCGQTVTGSCSGSTANCKGTLCDLCNAWYGEGNPNVHSFNSTTGKCKDCMSDIAKAEIYFYDEGIETGFVYYQSLAEALVEAEDGAFVHALADSNEALYIQSGVHLEGDNHTFSGSVDNSGTILSGTFTGEVRNLSTGRIEAGTFHNKITNSGSIINNNPNAFTLGNDFTITNEEGGTVICADDAHIASGVGTCSDPKKCRLCGETISQVVHVPQEGTTCTANNNGTHSYTCSACGQAVTESCSGGTQTCKGFQCQFCSYWYGEENPNAHIPQEGTYTPNNNGTHSYTCSACGQAVTESCSGGTKTCKGILCVLCNAWNEDEKDPNAHSFDPNTDMCAYCGRGIAEAKVGDQPFNSLSDALSHVRNNPDSTLVLLADVYSASSLTFDNLNFTLDLNGFDITVESGPAILLTGNSQLTIADSGNTGSIRSKNSACVDLQSSTTLQITGGTLLGGGTSYGSKPYGFVFTGRAQITISGGTIDGALNNAVYKMCLGSDDMGATFPKGFGFFDMAFPDFLREGVSFWTVADNKYTMIKSNDPRLENGPVFIRATCYHQDPSKLSYTLIDGGQKHQVLCGNCNNTWKDNCTFDSATGNCEHCPAEMAVAKVSADSTTTYYETISDACNSALNAEGSTLTLLKDVTDFPILISPEDSLASFTLDLNGRSIGPIQDALQITNCELTITDSGTGGSITGSSNDIQASDSTITLGLGKDGTGVTFPGGITVVGTTLNAILADGASYWATVDGKDTMLKIDDNDTAITDKGDIIVKATCYHQSGNLDYTYADGEEHEILCKDCNNTWKEPCDIVPATCKSPAVCSKCENEFGESDPDAHILTYRAGGATITVSCEHHPEHSGTATVSAEDKIYDGESASVHAQGSDILEGKNFTVAYGVKGGEALDKAPVNAGTYTASITLEGATATTEFTIEKATPVVTPPTSAGDSVYNALDRRLEQEAGTTTGGKLCYARVYNDSTVINWDEVLFSGRNAGAYKVYYKVIGDQNYKDIAQTHAFTVNITPCDFKDITVTAALSESSVIYNGKQQKPAVTEVIAQFGGQSLDQTLTEGTDYTVSYAHNMDVGTATATITGIGNYTGTVEKNFAIEKAPAQVIYEDLPVYSYVDKTYTVDLSACTPPDGMTWGSDVTYEIGTVFFGDIFGNNDFSNGSVKIEDGKLILPIRAGYAPAGTRVGQIDVRVSSRNIAESTIQINAKVKELQNANDKITAEIPNVTYGEEPMPACSFTGTSGSNPSWFVFYGANNDRPQWKSLDEMQEDGKLPAGTYKAKVVYTDDTQMGEKVVTFKVLKADPAVEKPGSLTATYGDLLKSVTLPSGWAWTASEDTRVGDAGTGTFRATYTPEDTKNYSTKTVDLNVTVRPKAITNAALSSFAPMTYTGKAQTPVAAVAVDGLTVTGTWSNVTNVADKTTFTANGNFTGKLENMNPAMAKANAPKVDLPVQTHFASYATENTVDLTRHLPADRGTAAFTLESVTGDIFSIAPAVTEAGVLTYTTRQLDQAPDKDTEIRIKVVMGNYADTDLKITVKLNPITADTMQQVVKQELTQVPAGLTNTAFNTLDKIREAQQRVLIQSLGGKTMDGITHYDMKLQFSPDGGQTWVNATEENFPSDGLTVTLPYPSGTGKDSHHFTVSHMFTAGNRAGTTETPAVSKTETGLRFKVTGLSPVSVAWSGILFDVHTGTVTNGTVHVSPAQAKAGSQVSIKATPNSGYRLSTLTVTDSSGKVCILGTDNDDSYFFTMPAADVTVKATFVSKYTASADPTNPKTGDVFHILFWSGMMMTTLLGAAAMVLNRKKFVQ